MAYTTIDDGSKYFQALHYTGNDTGRSLTNTGNSDLQPDLVWVKDRDATNDHKLTDSSRLGGGSGPTRTLESNTENAEYDDQGEGTDATTAFNSDGFTIGTNGNYNTDGNDYVAWQWKANGGTTSSFTESGNNPGGTYQANTTAGFSIVTTTGTGGLGAVPHWMISKGRSNSGGWVVYHHKNTSAPQTDALNLAATTSTTDSSVWYNDTSPTSSVFTLGTTNDVNGDSRTYIHYLWTEIKGFSKFGSYKGNGNADGPFVYTGFKPAFMIAKETGASRNWTMADNLSQTAGNGGVTNSFQPNTNAAKDANERMDWLSNGFKLSTTSTTWNTSGGDFIYIAFAEHPFVSSKGVPATAR
jgi:hypothetical protein